MPPSRPWLGPTARPGSGSQPMRSKDGLSAAIRQRRRAALVVNTRSRRGRRLYLAVITRLRAAGFDLLGSFPVRRPGELGVSLTAAMNLRPDLLIVGGGDGSISEAARRLACLDMALGVLPLGTTNNFARTLGIPLNLAEATDVLVAGKVADVDLGRAGGVFFANLVSVGLSAYVAANVPHQLKRLAGRAAYPVTALAGLPRHRPFHARITVGDQNYTLDTHQLNIANGSFHAGRPITGDASADDRLLLVYPSAAAAAGHWSARPSATRSSAPAVPWPSPRFWPSATCGWTPTRPCPSTWTARSSATLRRGSPWHPTRCASWSSPASWTPERFTISLYRFTIRYRLPFPLASGRGNGRFGKPPAAPRHRCSRPPR